MQRFVAACRVSDHAGPMLFRDGMLAIDPAGGVTLS